MQGQPNIIFLMLDTVRADVLRLYGGKLRTQNIESLAQRSMVFENAIAPGTYTLPSHLSIFLGKRPRSVRELRKDNMKHYNKRTDPFLKKSSYIKGNEITLAKHLSYLGYDTALFSNNPFVSSSAGVSDGFSHVDNMFVDEKIRGGSLPLKALLGMINSDATRNNIIRLACAMSMAFSDETMDRVYLKLRKKVDMHYSERCGYYDIDCGAKLTNDRIKQYLNRSDGGRNFIFVNYMEGHEGYPTNLITGNYGLQDKWLHIIGHDGVENVDVEREAYMRRIGYLDARLGELLETLKKKGVLDNAYVIIAADHGQAFMEHGQMYHNLFPYNEIVRVPLVISRFENGRQVNIKKRVRSPYSLTSLNGMIQELAYGVSEINLHPKNVAVSDHLGITEVWDTYLLKLLKSRSSSANAIYNKKLHFNKFATAIFRENYKLIHFYGAIKDELYDLREDGLESSNIIETNRSIARAMIRQNRIVS